MTRSALRITCLVLVLAGVSGIPDAMAFKVYNTRTDGSGEPIRWCTGPVQVHVSAEPPEEVSVDDVIDATKLAIERWGELAECETPEIEYAGKTEINLVERFDECDVNQNIVVFVKEIDTWADKGFASRALAMTTLTFDENTGVLVDADIELNDWNFLFAATTPVPHDRVDVANTLVHEMGHLQGLDHSTLTEATMYFKSPSGESKKRSLHTDDIEGVCYLYTYDCPSSFPPLCNGNGAYAEGSNGADAISQAADCCPVTDYGAGGGSCSVPARGGHAAEILLLLLGALALRASRRSPARP